MTKTFQQSNREGFTLLEALVGIGIFAIIAVSVYETALAAARLVQVSRLMVASAALANEQFEIIHNLPYSDVGLPHGVPSGTLAAEQHLTRDQADFVMKTMVQNHDDSFDGIAGGAPNDTSPADYKLVELTISAPDNPRFAPQTYTEYIAPKNVENSSVNGALFVRVFDANGQPVPGASVHIVNDLTSPTVLIDDVTNNDGNLQIIDTPPAIVSYQITVTKEGYSQDQTYPAGAPANPNPSNPHATVITQQVTQTSFAIDRTGTLNMETVTNTCAPVGSVAFSLTGSKLIGTGPDIKKYATASFSTDASGSKNITGLEWDTYDLALSDSAYDLAGTISPLSFTLNPAGTQDVKVVVIPKNPDSLLVNVEDASTHSSLSSVTVKLEKGTSSAELITGRGTLRQTDWSGGSGQNDFLDPAKYYSSDGNVEVANPAGEARLKDAFGNYALSGELISSIFDTGSASNFYQIFFTPTDQPPETGTSSVLIQVASNNDNSYWNFTGPDGATTTYYTAANGNLNAVNNGNRYFRYRLILSTASTTYTPNVGDVSFTFCSLCVPPGQVIFTGLEDGNYTLTLSKPGYQTLVENITLNSPAQSVEKSLQPE